MPWGETASDFLTGQMERSRTRKNDQWQKLMDALGLAKDVWTTLSGREEAKKAAEQEHTWKMDEFQPGSPQEQAAKRKLDMELQSNKDWLDYQNKNPGKPADQLTAEFYLTPEGQAYLDKKYEEAKRTDDMQTTNQIRVIRAGQEGKGMGQDAWDAFTNAIKTAQEKFLDVDPATGGVVWKKGITQQAVKNFLYATAQPPFVNAADAPALKQLFDQWIADPYWEGAQAGATKLGGTPGVASGIEDNTPAPGSPMEKLLKVFGTAQKVEEALKAVAPRDTTNIGTLIKSETALETQLDSLLPIITDKQDKKLATGMLTDSRKPGVLDERLYDSFMVILDYLRNKYAPVQQMSPETARRTYQ